MANQEETKANAFKENEIYTVSITGFTYIRDWAMVRGTINGQSVGIIIGDKMTFGMRDMFELKQSEGLRASFKKMKTVNGKEYPQFQLQEILF